MQFGKIGALFFRKDGSLGFGEVEAPQETILLPKLLNVWDNVWKIPGIATLPHAAGGSSTVVYYGNILKPYGSSGIFTVFVKEICHKYEKTIQYDHIFLEVSGFWY